MYDLGDAAVLGALLSRDGLRHLTITKSCRKQVPCSRQQSAALCVLEQMIVWHASKVGTRWPWWPLRWCKLSDTLQAPLSCSTAGFRQLCHSELDTPRVVCGQRPDGQSCREVGGCSPWLSGMENDCSPGWEVRLGDIGCLNGTYWLLVRRGEILRVHRSPYRHVDESVAFCWLLVLLMVVGNLDRIWTLAGFGMDLRTIGLLEDYTILFVWVLLCVAQWSGYGCAIACWFVTLITHPSSKGCYRLHCTTPSSTLQSWALLTFLKFVLPWLAYPNNPSLLRAFRVLALVHWISVILVSIIVTWSVIPCLPGSTANHILSMSAAQQPRTSLIEFSESSLVNVLRSMYMQSHTSIMRVHRAPRESVNTNVRESSTTPSTFVLEVGAEDALTPRDLHWQRL